MSDPEYDGERTTHGELEWPDPAVRAAFDLCPSKEDKEGNEIEGAPKRNMSNLLMLLRTCRWWRGCIGYDGLRNQITLRSHMHGEWVVLTDNHATNARAWIGKVYGLEFNKDDVFSAIASVASDNRYHAVQDYLNGLHWDGVVRLDSWLSRYLGAKDSALGRAIGRLWMVGAAKRILEPGCQFDAMLVLRGAQGAGKSTTARILARSRGVGGPLPDDTFAEIGGEVSDKDTAEIVAGSWIIEMGELDALRRSEVSAVKQFLTKTKERFRPAYGRCQQTFLRQCGFVGTVNDAHFLTDATGSRRFWIVEFVRLSPDFAADVDQLWAEAVHLVKDGVLPFLPKELEEQREEAAKEYETQDPWVEFISKYIARNLKSEYSNEDLLIDALGHCRAQTNDRLRERVHKAMVVLGYKKQRSGSVDDKGHRPYIYVKR